MKLHAQRSQLGFTLVEIVTVLALLGILSAVAFSRLGNVDSYTQSIYTQQLLSYLRLTQRTAVAHQGSGASLSITRTTSDTWGLTLQFDGQTVNYNLEGNLGLQFASAGNSGSISTGDTLSLVYSDLGDLVQITSPSVFSPTASLALTIAGSQQACVSLTGFAYEGPCL